MKANEFGCWVGWDDDKQGGEWEAWANGGKTFWSGAFRLDPNENWEWFAVTISGGDAVEECDADGIEEAIHHLLRACGDINHEPEPQPEAGYCDDPDLFEAEYWRRFNRLSA